MTRSFDRRRFLGAAVGTTVSAAALGALVRSVAWGQEAALRLSVAPLAPGMVLVSGAGGNVLAAEASGGAVVVDGGVAARSADVLGAIKSELSVQSVQALFNTHWHHDRIGLNVAVAEAGGRIFAHENTRLWLGAEIKRPWDDVPFAPLPAAARPSETFYETGESSFGQRQVRYGYLLQAHTDGDIYVHFPDENVLAAGGAVSGEGWPLIDWWTGGWIGGLIDGLEILLAVADGDTRIVPGDGPVMTRADLEAQREMYLTIFDRLMDLFFAARGPDEAVAAAVTKEFDARRGDSRRFVTTAFQSIGLHFAPDA